MPGTVIIFERLAVALALGLLIGMERGWKTRELDPGERVAGVRTFAVIGFLGGLAALLTLQTSAATLAAALLAVGGMLALNHWYTLSRQDADAGATTLIAALATFGLGALAGFGQLAVAAAGGVVMTIVLGVKQELHGFLKRLEHHELMAGLQLLAISVVLLPVLPNADYGPMGAINPYEIWWMVVLIAGLSFLGYVAIRIAGTAHGVMLTGLIGGFASSTVIAVNMSRLRGPDGDPGRDALLATGAVAALATMFPRVLVIAAAIAPGMAVSLAWALVPACLGTLASVAWRWRRAAEVTDTQSLQPRKPFELRIAVEFAFILTVIMVAVEAARLGLGDQGLYALGLLAGLFDVDAIALSFAQMTAEDRALPGVGVVALALGVLANMFVKPILLTIVGAPAIAKHTLWPLALAALLGAGGLALGDHLGGQTTLPALWTAGDGPA
jgi:uncharacterized membrane protein (DUF4010 family)